MNYSGRVLGQQFSGDFLKEALRHASPDMPYRGPEYYQSGEYTYKCSVAGKYPGFRAMRKSSTTQRRSTNAISTAGC